MKGLIIKDALTLKTQWKIYLAYFVLYGIISFTNENMSSFFGMILVLLAVMIPISTISYDERCQWQKYALSMPLSRRDIVYAKYLFSLLLTAFGITVGFVFNLCVSSIALNEILLTASTSAAVALIMSALLLPLMLILGVEKGRMAMFLVFAIPFALIFLIDRFDISLPSTSNIIALLIAAPIVSLIVFGISLMISLKAYDRKEF